MESQLSSSPYQVACHVFFFRLSDAIFCGERSNNISQPTVWATPKLMCVLGGVRARQDTGQSLASVVSQP